MLVFYSSLAKKTSYLLLPILIMLAIFIRIYRRLDVKRINRFCKSYREKSTKIPNNFQSEGEEGLMILFKLCAFIKRKKDKSFQSSELQDSLYTMW